MPSATTERQGHVWRWQSADSGYDREAEAGQPGAGGPSPNVCAGRADGRGARRALFSPLPVNTAKELWSQSRSQRAGKVHAGRAVTEINSN